MKREQRKQIYLFFEFTLFFFGVPLFLLVEADLLHPSSVLIPLLLIAFILLKFFTNFKWRELWAFSISRELFLKHLTVAFAVSLVMIGWVYLFDRENLFNLPVGNWKIWLMLSTFYPIFSAYVQEVIFKTYIFKRYKYLFQKGWSIIFASAAAFSFAHIFYFHPVSLALTFFLGLYLGWLYQKTQSVLFVAFLHGLYGNMVFTIGLGHYFWLDMHRWL